tara:strand:+ start:262 stop:492 length:231 start_codon:yes stop_codon:yes gene_type:complete
MGVYPFRHRCPVLKLLLPASWLQVRQLLSIVLSILFFGHPINLAESAGIGLVFVTLAYQIYAKYKASKQAALEKEP